MGRYKCSVCGFVYDEQTGIPPLGVAAGTRFSELPDEAVCPFCWSPSEVFKLLPEKGGGDAGSNTDK